MPFEYCVLTSLGANCNRNQQGSSQGCVSDGIGNIYWNDIPGKVTHRDGASWTHLTTILLWQEYGNINTYGKISANNSYNPVTGQMVPAVLNMHDSVHIGDAMERQSLQWNHWIPWSHMHSDRNYVIKMCSKTARPGKLLGLMIFFLCSWRWVNNDSWA